MGLMERFDDALIRFDAEGAPPLPPGSVEGYVRNDGASIWYAAYGSGFPVVLLHGGLGHAGNWGYQVPTLVEHGYRAVVMDSRGHGRSTRDRQSFSYGLMGSDAIAVMHALGIGKAAFVGWSDGACTALVLAREHPERVAGVFYFAGNVDPTGVKEIVFDPHSALGHCFSRHTKDYAALSPAPEGFKALGDDLAPMQRTQPNYSASELAEIHVPVVVVQAEKEEFIKPKHAAQIAGSMPNADLLLLPGVSHFAPLQRPSLFNDAMLNFLSRVSRPGDNLS
jgi:pimeloyl-ACP methyl ester carboxylesterase